MNIKKIVLLLISIPIIIFAKANDFSNCECNKTEYHEWVETQGSPAYNTISTRNTTGENPNFIYEQCHDNAIRKKFKFNYEFITEMYGYYYFSGIEEMHWEVCQCTAPSIVPVAKEGAFLATLTQWKTLNISFEEECQTIWNGNVVKGRRSCREVLYCEICYTPSDPTPTPPEDTNTTEWKLIAEVPCSDKNATLPDTCTDANVSGIVVQSWTTGCCGTNSRCYQSVPKCDENQTLDMNATPSVCVDNPPTCDQNDTDFPALKTQESVLYEWATPDDLSAQCSNVEGNVQQRVVSCIDNYRCTCPYKAYPNMADNEEVFFKWSANSAVDKTSLCTAFKGHVQQERQACATNYRCVGLTETQPLCTKST